MFRIIYVVIGGLLVRIVDVLSPSSTPPLPLWWLLTLLVFGALLATVELVKSEKR